MVIPTQVWIKFQNYHKKSRFPAFIVIFSSGCQPDNPWLLWWPPAESHYNIYDHSAVGYVSHAHFIVLLYSVGNKITTTTSHTIKRTRYFALFKKSVLLISNFTENWSSFRDYICALLLIIITSHFFYVNCFYVVPAVRLVIAFVVRRTLLQKYRL